MVSPVLKPTKPNLDLISNPTAVLTVTRNVILINWSGIFWSAPIEGEEVGIPKVILYYIGSQTSWPQAHDCALKIIEDSKKLLIWVILNDVNHSKN